MSTLTPHQREAYNAFRNLWDVQGFTRRVATRIFLDITGYSEVPYFMNLDVPECERITSMLALPRLEQIIAKMGRESGVCQVCLQELTDPESIERGIGPICAGKFKPQRKREFTKLEDLLT